MKPKYIFLILLLICSGCIKDISGNKPFCNFEDPINELPWLKEIIDEQQNNKYNKMIISKYEYNKQEGFLVDSCMGCSDSLAVFYDCLGTTLCKFGGKNSSNTCPDFLTNSIGKEIVFIDTIVAQKPATFFCEVDNPLEDLEWLKTIVYNRSLELANKTKISQCIYDGNQAFLINWCVQCPDGDSELFSCDSTLLCKFGGIGGQITCPDFEQKTTDIKLIWQNF